MAKLNGVKTIDMVNGEITKVEYDGAVYTKVGGVSKSGDVLLRTKRGMDDFVIVGNFYECPKDGERVLTWYIDEEGERLNSVAENFAAFRKVTEVSQPFAEMITAKVEAVGKRVSALEGEKKPEFSEGDRVKTLTCCEDDDIKAGEYGVVVDTDCGSYDDPYSIRVDTDDDYGYFRPQDLEMAAENTPVKVGDYAVVLATYSPMSGKVVEVRKEDAVAYDFRVYTLCGGENELFDAYELRKATDAEVAAATAPTKPKTGDIVVITGESHVESRGCRNEVGDIGIVVRRGATYKSSVKVSVPSRNQDYNFTHESEMRLATPAEIAKYESSLVQMEKDAVFAKAGRKPNEYRKGDVVRVRYDSPSGANLRKGEVGVITQYDSNGSFNVTEKDCCWVDSSQVEIVSFAENRVDMKEVA